MYDYIKTIKNDSYSNNFIMSIYEKLKAAKIPFAVAGMVAAMGIYDLVEQPCRANMAQQIDNTMQVALLSKAKDEKFLNRMDSLSRKLETIKLKALQEMGEQGYNTMLSAINKAINECTESYKISKYEKIKQQIIKDRYKEKIVFFSRDDFEAVHYNLGNTLPIPGICTAQGQRWCEPTVGLYFSIVDPRIKKQNKLNSVTVPRMDDNTVSFRIPTRYVDNRFMQENNTYNKLIFYNAMQYVYRFLNEEIPQEQLDMAITDTIKLGQGDRTASNLLKEGQNYEVNSKERANMNIRIEIVRNYPEATIQKQFNGKTYTFKYDNFGGYIILEFPFY